MQSELREITVQHLAACYRVESRNNRGIVNRDEGVGRQLAPTT